MRTHRWIPLLLLLTVAVGVTACSSDSGDASSSGDEAAADATVDAGAGEDAQETSTGALPAGDPVQAGRSIIATAEVTVEVDDATAAAARAVEVAASSGGFLAQQEALPADGIVTMTLRIPTEQFSSALGELAELGEVQAQRVDTQDVTEQVVDLESRIASARVSVARVRDLLERSGDVAQLATVEGELSRREAELESLLGRQRVLADQVDLSTVRLDLREPAAVVEDDEDALPGFMGGLRNGWRGFIAAASVLVTALGYALPFLLVAAAGGGIWLKLRHRPVTSA